MVWNLGVLFYRMIANLPTFSAIGGKTSYAQLDIIQAVLGSPGESVRNEWVKLAERYNVNWPAGEWTRELDARIHTELPGDLED
jgi:hypothetical protein